MSCMNHENMKEEMSVLYDVLLINLERETKVYIEV